MIGRTQILRLFSYFLAIVVIIVAGIVTVPATFAGKIHRYTPSGGISNGKPD